MKRLFLLLLFPILGTITLDKMMTRDEKERTGVNDLNYTQKQELEGWLNSNFDEKEDRKQKSDQLYLSLNIDNGSKLELSDGSTYEVAPEDRLYSVYWITPFPLRLSDSDDDKYPIKITNMNTGTSVNARQISTRQMLEEHQQRARERQQLQQQQQMQFPSPETEPQPQMQQPKKPTPKEAEPEQKPAPTDQEHANQ